MYPVKHEANIKMINEQFTDLYNQYLQIYGDAKGKGPENYSSYIAGPQSSVAAKKKFDDFMVTLHAQGTEKNDMEVYFDEKPFPNVPQFDALSWWKSNEVKYPVLSKMAKDILSIPITTVCSESTFSAGGRIIDKKRACMRRDTIEVLLCGGDWIKEAYGIRSLKEGNDDPTELEHEKEFEMKDSNASNGNSQVHDGEAPPQAAPESAPEAVPAIQPSSSRRPPFSFKKKASQLKKRKY